MADKTVGRVAGLWRYPVKSMAGEALLVADLSWHGVPGDRRWAFVRPDMQRSGFPWLTIRQRGEMWQYRPSLDEPESPDASPVKVRTPSGEELDVADPKLADELGRGVKAMKQDRGIFDVMSLSLISAETLAALSASCGRELEVERFRPNVLVETADGRPFQEDEWVGEVLRLGEARVRLDQRDDRCVIVNVDPGTAERDPAVLREIARSRESCLGVYGSTVAPGLVAVGDPVVLVGR